MKTTVAHKEWTEESLMSLPDNGNKYELVKGKLKMNPAGFEHESIGLRLGGALERFVRENKLGIVCGSSAGYWMKSGNFRSPDVSFVGKDRLKGFKRLPKGFLKGAPNLAVEILSPSDTVEELHEKVVEYFDNGSQLVWVVNPEEQIVLVYHSQQPEKLLRKGDNLDGENIVSGFSLPVSDLFTELAF
ncbi:MAG: hypothetical protein SCARUB_04876 [Candidatus Scalindua rubra]|uniref:Putative restriction endonuclease domain-containing protein n=1 Tax=Candidatus Scalindua rubra TaxID=1872076 RepID=A0A1E3X315_9BACT|nr:MAG: hypothetical protein SCARUB_04876 [Candidatus Scalindua rubra]